MWFWTFWLCAPTIPCVDQSVKRFGQNVRVARLARDWTQEDLAHESGLAPVQVSRIERGVREIRLTTLLRLLSALDVPSTELLEGTHGPDSKGP